jgi:predicted transglutaminase-like cysteine proteinase
MGWYTSSSTLAGIAHGLELSPYTLFMPENAVSQEITKIAGKLIREINTAVNQSVKAINSAAVCNKNEKKK